jgi:hypothetical protein
LRPESAISVTTFTLGPSRSPIRIAATDVCTGRCPGEERFLPREDAWSCPWRRRSSPPGFRQPDSAPRAEACSRCRRPRSCEALAGLPIAPRIRPVPTTNDLDGWLVALEHGGNSTRRGRGTGTVHERVHLSLSLIPDFLTQGCSTPRCCHGC